MIEFHVEGEHAMSYMPFVIILAALGIVVLALIAYRSKLTAHEDDTIHIHDGEEGQMAAQAVLAKRVEKVDMVGKILTGVVVVGAAALLAAWVYFEQIADSSVRM
jgi:hypothetical protein